MCFDVPHWGQHHGVAQSADSNVAGRDPWLWSPLTVVLLFHPLLLVSFCSCTFRNIQELTNTLVSDPRLCRYWCALMPFTRSLFLPVAQFAVVQTRSRVSSSHLFTREKEFSLFLKFLFTNKFDPHKFYHNYSATGFQPTQFSFFYHVKCQRCQSPAIHP